jgi:iron complex transport system ATP-binding protein
MRSLGVTTIAALHDLNLAAAYCDQLVMLAHGSVQRSGAPADVLTAALVEQVYGVTATIGVNPLTGKPHLFVGGAPIEGSPGRPGSMC